MSEPNHLPARAEFLLYQTEDGHVRLETRLQNETIWLTINQLATLFGVDKSGISRHLKNIYETGELRREATVAKFATVQQEGERQVSRELECYNLDAIISVGYRVNSIRGTQFRIWATERLKEFIIKGFTLDDERLKEPDNGRYFEELLARIRDIRSSEKIFWRKVLDIYATSIDYDPHTETSKMLFKQVQNKMHWAAHGHTAAELIYQRADADRPHMGITNHPGARLLKRDVEVAKNYLGEEELNILNRIVTAYLEIAELQAMNRAPMTMADWIERLHQFLTMTGRELLTHAGSISHDTAMAKAHDEYEKFRLRQLSEPTEVENHFIEAERELKQIESTKKKGGRHGKA
ncbi:MAG: virulence RhuM family protein [Desulfobulbus sp.]|nr:virulence RhuM family protein [Desulfobulbus sp.]